MFEKATELIKWLTSLEAGKLVIALLLILVAYFGYNSFTADGKVEEMQKQISQVDSLRVNDTKECNTRIESAVKRKDSLYEAYRNKIDDDVRKANEENKKTIDALYEQLGIIKRRANSIDNKANKIEEQIKE